MNPALEAQAIGRVHRLGQKRDVEIIRLQVKDSLESRLVGSLKEKYGGSDNTTTNKDDTGDQDQDQDKDENTGNNNDNDGGAVTDKDKDKNNDGGGKGLARLPTGQEKAGSLMVDKADLVTDEFDRLFGVFADPADDDTASDDDSMEEAADPNDESGNII